MANNTVVEVVQNGPHNYTVKATGILDTSDVAVADLIDTTAAAFKAPNAGNTITGDPYTVNILEVDFAIEDTLAFHLWWDATADVLAGTFTGRGEQRYLTPLKNSAGAGKTGKLQYSTQGWSAGAILSYTVIVKCRKAYS